MRTRPPAAEQQRRHLDQPTVVGSGLVVQRVVFQMAVHQRVAAQTVVVQGEMVWKELDSKETFPPCRDHLQPDPAGLHSLGTCSAPYKLTCHRRLRMRPGRCKRHRQFLETEF